MKHIKINLMKHNKINHIKINHMKHNKINHMKINHYQIFNIMMNMMNIDMKINKYL